MNRTQYGVVVAAGMVLLSLGAGAATLDASTAASTSDRTSGGAGGDDVEMNLTEDEDVLPVLGDPFRQLANDSDDAAEGADASGRNRGGDGGDAGDSTVLRPSLPVAVLAAVGVVALVSLALVARRGDDADGASAVGGDDDEGDVDGEALAAVSASAGRAASRLEREASPDNVVYETWLEMARSLDVERPASSTPGEFAAAAVDAGMSRPDVDRLTALFRDVRYGGDPPTRGREEAARDAFGRIERAYEDADGDPGVMTDDGGGGS